VSVERFLIRKGFQPLQGSTYFQTIFFNVPLALSIPESACVS
jgi:hypothetical protein